MMPTECPAFYNEPRREQAPARENEKGHTSDFHLAFSGALDEFYFTCCRHLC